MIGNTKVVDPQRIGVARTGPGKVHLIRAIRLPNGPVNAVGIVVIMPVTAEPPCISQQCFGRIRIPLQGHFITSLALPAGQIGEQHPRVGFAAPLRIIGRCHIETAVIRTVPPLKVEVVRIGAKVALMAQHHVFVKDVVGKNGFDGTAITFVAVDLDDVRCDG